MVKRIECYEDATGKLHRDPFEAHRADLAHWFTRSGDVTDTSAKKLTDWLVATPEMTNELIDLLKAIQENRPEAPQAVAPARVYEDEAV